MKRRIYLLVCVLVLLVSSGLGAMESMWGGRVKQGLDFPEIKIAGCAFNTSTMASAWYSGKWSSGLRLRAEAGVGVNLGFPFTCNIDNTIQFDVLHYSVFPVLNVLNVYGYSDTFHYKAGRQMAVDPALIIIASPFDGFSGSIQKGGQLLWFGAGYTGGTFRQSSNYSMTLLDLPGGDMSPRSFFSASRFLEYAGWRNAVLTPWMDLSVYILAVQDAVTQKTLDSYNAKAFYPVFLEVKGQGSINDSWMYSIVLAAQYGICGSTHVLGGAADLMAAWLPDEKSQLSLRLRTASGDNPAARTQYRMGAPSAAMLHQYTPVSRVGQSGFVVPFESGNITAVSLTWKKKFTNSFAVTGQTTTLLRSTGGVVSSTLVPTTDNGHFLGQEALVHCVWRNYSDFGWDLQFGLLAAGNPIQLAPHFQTAYLDKAPLMARLNLNCFFSF